MLLDQLFYRQQEPYWFAAASNLSLSEQFVLSNSLNENYCSGGNALTGLTYLNDHLGSVEFSSNVPYNPTGAANVQNFQQNVTTPLSAQTSLHKLLPFKTIQDSNQASYSSPNQGIYADSVSFTSEAVQLVMSTLSRGIAVLGEMMVNMTTESFQVFQGYVGDSVLFQECSSTSADHQIVFVGYGTKNGKRVWVVRNSWGSTWGSEGHFYIEIGKNSYCAEFLAFSLIPKYYQDNDTVFTKGQFTSAFSLKRD